jgi:tRNA-specific 2-thiouridylase
MKKKIAVGLSGGVDSSVAAYLLIQQGFDVVGFTLKFYPHQNRCCDSDSLYQAQRLCYALDIPHYTLDMADVFRQEIVDYFIGSYLNGLTPNPCVYCNRLVKFGLFLQKLTSLGIDYLATGHYARIDNHEGACVLRPARDTAKSQEYFLALLKSAVLSRLIFPLADRSKEEVKQIAKEKKIIFQERKESQDVCFANGKDYAEFIEEHITDYKRWCGPIRYIDGKILGEHRGIYRYTRGQRYGLGLSWPRPLYVISIEAETRTVIVGEKEHLLRDNFTVHSLNWFLSPETFEDLEVRVRYNAACCPCRLTFRRQGAEVSLAKEIDSVTPGQLAAFYSKGILLGGGIIA